MAKHLRKVLFFTLFSGNFIRANEAKKEEHHEHKTEAKKPETKAAKKFVDRINCEAMAQKSGKDQWGMAQCFFKMGAYPKAVEILREIYRKNPKDLEAYFTSSWLLWSDGHLQGGDTEKKRTLEAIDELQKARISNPTHWEVDTEIGDFYLLRLNLPQKAYAEYLKARSHFDGDYSRSVPKASNGRKAAIEDRVARVAEILDNKGEAVESSCRALFFDPDDKSAENRITKLGGSCIRKKVKDPRESEQPSEEKLDAPEKKIEKEEKASSKISSKPPKKAEHAKPEHPKH